MKNNKKTLQRLLKALNMMSSYNTDGYCFIQSSILEDGEFVLFHRDLSISLFDYLKMIRSSDTVSKNDKEKDPNRVSPTVLIESNKTILRNIKYEMYPSEMYFIHIESMKKYIKLMLDEIKTKSIGFHPEYLFKIDLSKLDFTVECKSTGNISTLDYSEFDGDKEFIRKRSIFKIEEINSFFKIIPNNLKTIFEEDGRYGDIDESDLKSLNFMFDTNFLKLSKEDLSTEPTKIYKETIELDEKDEKSKEFLKDLELSGEYILENTQDYLFLPIVYGEFIKIQKPKAVEIRWLKDKNNIVNVNLGILPKNDVFKLSVFFKHYDTAKIWVK